MQDRQETNSIVKDQSNSSVILKNKNNLKFKIDIPEVKDESFYKDNKYENLNNNKSLSTKSKNLNNNLQKHEDVKMSFEKRYSIMKTEYEIIFKN